jgi:N-acetylglucosamine kinase-like BadF-type ATPase
MSKFYLGVDGGQSSTKALIADEQGRIVGYGVGGPCNHVSGPEAREKFRSAVGSCIQQACEQARLDASTIQFAAACLGFSGGAEDKDAFTRELIRSSKYKITHDAEIALSGATAGRPGIIVIAGTGSMAFGRNASGKTARAGGWGYIFGDEGGAFDLVRQALRYALKFEEGWGLETVLHDVLLRASGARNANELLHWFYTKEYPRDRIATFAPLVTDAAAKGDKIAQMIVRMAAANLMWLVRGVHYSLFGKFERVLICHVGGVFRSECLRADFVAEVKRGTRCDVSLPVYGAAAGAVLEAMRLDDNLTHLSGVPESER